MSEINVEKLVEKILAIASDNDLPIIGIDGLGGAGKSTVSQTLKESFESNGYNVVLLHIDDFILQKSIRYNDAYPQWQCYYDLQWRYNYFIGMLSLIKSREEKIVNVDLYDKDTDCFDPEEIMITDKTIVIVEGVFLQRKELSRVFDYMVYLDVPEDERLRRVLARDKYIGSEEDIRTKYNERYFPAERYYVEQYSPKESADMVIEI